MVLLVHTLLTTAVYRGGLPTYGVYREAYREGEGTYPPWEEASLPIMIPSFLPKKEVSLPSRIPCFSQRWRPSLRRVTHHGTPRSNPPWYTQGIPTMVHPRDTPHAALGTPPTHHAALGTPPTHHGTRRHTHHGTREAYPAWYKGRYNPGMLASLGI